MKWIEINSPCPVLNTPDFATVFSGTSLPLNENGHPYHFEFVALPGMRFQEIAKVSPHILQIHWPEYGATKLYVDARFTTRGSPPSEKNTSLLCAQTLLQKMERRIGTSYVWGGNWAPGVPAMLTFYPPFANLSSRMEELWTLRGLDCSGLLFEASNGVTPRNTSHLLQYGTPIRCEERLRPMDMILYPGHVLFVRDSNTIIESKSPVGVRICPLAERLKEIPQFTIRRFAIYRE